MNKLGLAISISALSILALSSVALGAFRADPAGLASAGRESTLITQRGGDSRLVFINEKLYPDDVTITLAPIDDENATLRYAFSSTPVEPRDPDRVTTAASGQGDAWCDADCQSYANFVHWCAETACLLP